MATIRASHSAYCSAVRYPSRRAACNPYPTSASDAEAMLQKWKDSFGNLRCVPSTMFAGTEYAARRSCEESSYRSSRGNTFCVRAWISMKRSSARCQAARLWWGRDMCRTEQGWGQRHWRWWARAAHSYARPSAGVGASLRSAGELDSARSLRLVADPHDAAGRVGRPRIYGYGWPRRFSACCVFATIRRLRRR